MSLPQCIEGCPQHATRVRHKQRHRSRTVSKTSLSGEAGEAHASPRDFGEGCEQHESTQPHKKRSGQQSATPAFEAGVSRAFRGPQEVLGEKHEKLQDEGGVRGVRLSRAVQGVPGGSKGVQRFWAEKWLENARQMAQITRCLPWPTPPRRDFKV